MKIRHLIEIRIRAHSFVHTGDVGVRHNMQGEGLINRAVTIPAPEDRSVQQPEVAQPVVRIISHVLQVHQRAAMPNMAYVAGTVAGGSRGVSHAYELRG